MSVQVRRRREAAPFLSTFVGAQGELIVDTTNNRIQVHDGATPGGFAAAKLSEVVSNSRTAVNDANYAATVGDRMVAYTAVSAPRTLTLPSAAAYPTGTQLLIVDESGACSTTNAIAIVRGGSDTINGATNTIISTAFGYVALESNGAFKWTVVDQTPFSALTTVAQSASGANMQFGVLEQLITLSGTSVVTTLQIPVRSIVFAVSSRTIGAVTGAPSYGVGVSGNATQFGSGLGASVGSSNAGLIGPSAFYAAMPLVITATSGSFTAGQVRLAIQYLLCGAPTA